MIEPQPRPGPDRSTTTHPISQWQPPGCDGRSGDWTFTYSGRAFWPLDPRPEEVCLEDIAHALALKTRWCGHCQVFYSVAEHCVRVGAALGQWALDHAWSREQTARLELLGLLHDAHEAYLADLARPLKPYAYLDARLFDWKHPDGPKQQDDRFLEWSAAEALLDHAIRKHFQQWDPDEEERELIKRADAGMAQIEARALFPGDPARDWRGLDLGAAPEWVVLGGVTSFDHPKEPPLKRVGWDWTLAELVYAERVRDRWAKLMAQV